MTMLPNMLVFSFLALILYVLPGLALISLLGINRVGTLAEKFCLAGGLSIALYALLFHVFYLLKMAPGSLLVWIPCTAAAVLMSVIFLNRRFFSKKGLLEATPGSPPNKSQSFADWLFTAVFLATVALLVISRFAVVQGMTAAAWGDSVHHTVIVQLLQEHGGLFQSWAPYAPISSMTYHFGFHSAAAVWAWLANASSHQSVLLVGQVFEILVILALYPLTARVSKSRWVGLAVMILAGFLSPLPSFFTNWGRFPLLAGMIVGLTTLYFIETLFTDRGRSSFSDTSVKRGRSSFNESKAKKGSVLNSKPEIGLGFLLFLLLVGMWLSHYRFSFVILAAAAVWAMDALWRLRRDLKEWLRRALVLGVSGAAAALLLLPWVKITMSNKLLNAVMGSRGAELKQLASLSDIGLWKNLDFYYPEIFWILALVCFIPAFIFRPRFTRLIVFWAGLVFLLANPDLIGFTWGLGWLRNENLVFAFFLLFSALIGCVFGYLWEKMSLKPVGAGALFISAALLLAVGGRIQLRIIDPFFQMVEPSDVAVFCWIRQNTPEDSQFLVNGFVIGQGKMAYGSDAGWWLPYFTHRDNTVPPAQYSMEKLDPDVDKVSFARIIGEVRDSGGSPGKLREVLCREKITHIFLGERRGSVGYETQEMIPETWLHGNPNFTLLYSEGKAQVWRFERGGCEQP